MGEWDKEPDHERWTDTATGYDCVIKRMGAGHLCGYVGVGEDHQLAGSTDTLEMYSLDVHGGVTYSSRMEAADPGLWYIGFDCAHLGDKQPGYAWSGGTYRNFGYVKKEILSLANLLAKIDGLTISKED